MKKKIHEHKYRNIKVDFNNLKSIKKAEQQKLRLENQGYNQVKMYPIGYDKFILLYKK